MADEVMEDPILHFNVANIRPEFMHLLNEFVPEPLPPLPDLVGRAPVQVQVIKGAMNPHNEFNTWLAVHPEFHHLSRPARRAAWAKSKES